MLLRKQKNKADVKFILNHLRDEDIIESEFIYGENWKNQSIKNIMNPDSHVVIGVDKKTNIPICMGGVSPASIDSKGIGIVWFLSTNSINNYSYSILKEMQREIKSYDSEYWFLYNFIFYKNFLAKKWLKWLGFKFDLKNYYQAGANKEFEFFYRIRTISGLLD